jgi:hypothetical protein
MEEEIKFLKAQGRKEKRRSSSINVEIKSTHEFHLAAGDEIVFTTIFLEPGASMKIKLILGSSLDIYPGNMIKIKSELSPTITSVTIKK